MYDAIVIGARCAGSPTAMLLARKGYRVLLVDRAKFPSDVVNGYYIQQHGAARLEHWGLLNRVRASNCPPLRRITFDLGAFSLSGSPPPANGLAEGYAPRRTVLDKILVDAATEAGAELRENFPVHQLLRDGEHVTGIRGQTRAGKAITELGRIVIGADGVNSVVARAVDAETYNVCPALTCWYAAHWSGVPIDGVAFYLRNRRAIVACYTNDGLTVVLTSCPHDEFGQFRADVEGNYYKTLELVPELAAHVRAGRREERFVGTSSTANFFRKPYGPGWALVGDAGYHKDPSTAQGISDSFRDAELLTEAIDQGFSGRRPLAEALADYERRRNTSVRPCTTLPSSLQTLPSHPRSRCSSCYGRYRVIKNRSTAC